MSDIWVGRCREQISAALTVLEADRAAGTGDYWFGNRIGHADIAVASMLRFLAEAHPGLVSMAEFPALGAHAARLEGLPVFRTIAQPFVAPA
jgi:glutathione S-transferase